jgi:hypothetical protein
MSGPGMKWHRAGKPKRTEHVNTRFPRDPLGQRAKAAFVEWKASLSEKQQRILKSAPTR